MPLDKINDLSACTDYDTMQSYFIHKYAKDRSISVGTPFKWMSKRSNVKYQDLCNYLKRSCIDIKSINDIILAGVNSTKWFSDDDLQTINNLIKGKLYKIDDSNYFQDQYSFVFSHYTRDSRPSDRSIELSLAVASDLFVPQQNWIDNTLVVHIDHRWNKTERLNCFDEIKNVLHDLKKITYSHNKWTQLEIYYHTDKITDIERIGTYDPSQLSITKLSKIYGRCHLAFVSHAETLGQYPLEMLSSGATVISHKKMIPREIRKLYPFINLEKINLEKILNNLTEITSQENRKSILHFDYKNWVDKIFNHLTTEE